MSERDCPGVPYKCTHAQEIIQAALDGMARADEVTRLRGELEPCAPCVHAFDFEIRFRMVMSQRCREDAPPELRVRITEALSTVDLTTIDITDL